MISGVGAIFLSLPTSRILLQMRSKNVSHSSTWAFWGGKAEKDEKPLDTLERELEEEMGNIPNSYKIFPLHIFESNNGFTYQTFIITVFREFVPSLNNESSGYCWVDIGAWPKPLHSGAKLVFYDSSSINKIKTIATNLKDKQPRTITSIRRHSRFR
tara:strand:- start:5939 stop:6409 length:471 start_codon:yes stop_codon:yes gene_type:complete